MKEILVIIPAYNEAENIEQVIRDLSVYEDQLDYVIVNDGSGDATAALCRARGFNLIDLPVNLGLAGAFQTGMKYAAAKGYAAAIQFDADGQHRPEYILPIRQKMLEGYDVVIGSRFASEKRPASARMAGNILISLAIRLTTGKKITDSTSGMRMYNAEMIRAFADNINYGPEPDTISWLIRDGARVGEVQVHMQERTAGTSYLNFSRSVMYMLRMLLSILLIQNFRKKRERRAAS